MRLVTNLIVLYLKKCVYRPESRCHILDLFLLLLNQCQYHFFISTLQRKNIFITGNPMQQPETIYTIEY